MKQLRTVLVLLALGATSVALVACNGASADGDSDAPSATATATANGTDGGSATSPGDSDGAPNGDTPVSPGNTPGTSEPAPLPNDVTRVEVAAPIDSVEILIRESSPPQYSLQIVSGLPSGCAAFERIDVERDGNTFNVDVINTIPEPNANIACTMIYGTVEHTVALDGIVSGVEYTVNVNDQTITFVGQ